MPDDNKEKKASQSICFARRHMSMAAGAYHAYAAAVSRQSGVFYSDDRRDAREFGEEGVSNRTIFDLRRFLERKGWFVRIDSGRSRKRNRITGLFECVQYRILSHDQWTAAHPGHCRFSELKPDPLPPDAETTSGPAVETASGEEPPDANIASNLTQFLPTPDAKTAAKTVLREKEKKDREEAEAPTAADVRRAFLLFESQPFGPPRFQFIWAQEFLRAIATQDHGKPPGFSDAMEQAITRAQAEHIFVPARFYPFKRFIEKREVELLGGGKRRSSNPAAVTMEDKHNRLLKNARALGVDLETLFHKN